MFSEAKDGKTCERNGKIYQEGETIGAAGDSVNIYIHSYTHT